MREAAERLPAPLQAARPLAGKTATTPIRHPFVSPLAVQTPAALAHGGPKQYLKALGGNGTLAQIGDALGNTVGSVVPSTVGENLVHDAFNLPAHIFPAVYLPLAGAVEAAKGRPQHLEALLHTYLKTGLLPAAFRDDRRRR